MCVNQRWIRNKYDGTKHYVKCGQCEACRQEKAIARTNRIDSEFKSGRECLFVTLTYADPYVPYVRASEAERFLRSRAYELTGDESIGGMTPVTKLRVYRDYHAHQSNHGLVVTKLDAPIKELEYSDFSFHGKTVCPDWRGLSEYRNMHYRRRGVDYFHRGKIAVLNFDDVKSFYMKLRKYLKYRGYEERYEIFYCGEYGGDYARPHYHVLISIPQGHYELFKRAVLACWTYADHSKLEGEIDRARDPSSYLASYVNSGEDLPSFLADSPPFRPRHKYSHGFGMSLGDFSLSAVKEAVDRGTLEYDVLVHDRGVSSFRSVPIPKYVINRYFPKFKGFGRLAPDQIYNVLTRPSDVYAYAYGAGLTHADGDVICRHIRNLRKRLKLWTDAQWLDYVCYYISAHNRYYVTMMRHAYNDVSFFGNWQYFYYNISDFRRCRSDGSYYVDLSRVAPTLSSFSFDVDNLDPNYWSVNMRKHNRLITAWQLYNKNRKVSSELYKSKLKYG